MDVELIKMPKEEAHKKIEAYKKRLGKSKGAKVASEVNKEYQAAIKGYQALAEGTALLDLDEVFQNCPVDENGRPKLAIHRADRKQVRFTWDGGSTRAFFTDTGGSRQRSVVVDMGREHGKRRAWNDGTTSHAYLNGYSIVPMVPADVRPKFGQLKDMFILWEVEKWADDQIRATPDRDPYLLKHIHGSLYAVLAEWDLTDLERSIMKGRLS